MRRLPASLLILLCLPPAAVLAQAADAPAAPLEIQAEPPVAPVRFRGETLFEVRAPTDGRTAEERARAIESRLARAAAAPGAAAPEVRAEPGALSQEVFAGEQFIVSVADTDAHPLGRTREQFAADIVATLHGVLDAEFKARSVTSLLKGAAIALAGTLVFVVVAGLLWRRLRRHEDAWHERDREALSPVAVRGVKLLSVRQKVELATASLRVVRIGLAVLLTLVWAGFTMAQFPWTRGLSIEVQQETGAAFRRAVDDLVAYLPNLLNILVIVFVAYLLLRFARFFFLRVRRGQIRLHKFYPEWADPTYKIVRFVAIALVLVIIYPYLPASQSVAFQGVSVLLGVLVSIGSATAISNLIGGLVITYMRAFRDGDRVKIGDTEGDVVSRDAFVVRIRTVKNVEVTVPNTMVLTSHLVNYSKAARDKGLVLHTTVTIGYDVPWRQVHELLLAAAKDAEGIEADPAPFVLQKSLDDFYVCYELNAVTRQPQDMAKIYSRLHEGIQDRFAGAGVEILSPHYRAERDGSASTVPARSPA